jgi:hypothetical protein
VDVSPAYQQSVHAGAADILGHADDEVLEGIDHGRAVVSAADGLRYT